MLRKILSLLLGLFLSFTITSLVQALNFVIFDLPRYVDYSDETQVRQMIQNLPLGAIWIVEISYVLGSFFGGFVYVLVSKSKDIGFPIGIAVFLTFVGIINQIRIPQPIWFAILSTITYLPLVFLGRYFAMKIFPKRLDNEIKN